jgi:hypothetical protein
MGSRREHLQKSRRRRGDLYIPPWRWISLPGYDETVYNWRSGADFAGREVDWHLDIHIPL